MAPGFVLKYDDNRIFGYIRDLEDFVDKAAYLPDEVIKFHINNHKNDFLNWIKNSFNLNIYLGKYKDPIEEFDTLLSRIDTIITNQRRMILNDFPVAEGTLEEKIVSSPVKSSSFFKKFLNLLRERV